ncbi:hypothetical protein [Frankia sp. EI5c]|uniref:hypothetical protein n=1 Tax=Frankia sp. EI5c TaxID=683316 RepID=UPI000825BD48|nr:hypothetical protein [Frankia sp. EI5c]
MLRELVAARGLGMIVKVPAGRHRQAGALVAEGTQGDQSVVGGRASGGRHGFRRLRRLAAWEAVGRWGERPW